MAEITVEVIEKGSPFLQRLIDYAEDCPWIAGKHLARLLREEKLCDWERAFAAADGENIVGFCTFQKTDYYPENRYSPWISCVFVDEARRGGKISRKMIETAEDYARSCGFSRVYIPSDMVGFYEKYGYEKIDELENYGGDFDGIFMKRL